MNCVLSWEDCDLHSTAELVFNKVQYIVLELRTGEQLFIQPGALNGMISIKETLVTDNSSTNSILYSVEV